MEKEEYKIGTEEAGFKLGVSSRSVRRLAQQGALDGSLQTTSKGKQWFFTEASLESLIEARKERSENQKRHQAVKDTIGQNNGQLQKSEDSRGQPETTEDTSELDPPLPMPDEKRVKLFEKLLEKEQNKHAETRGKLEKKEAELLAEAKTASRLEGEKIGYEKMETQYRQLVAMFRDTMLKLQSPSAGDIFGQKSEDNRGQPETTEDTSEPRPKSKRKKQIPKKSGETTPKKSVKKTKDKLRVKSKPEREPKTKDNRQPKKSRFWKWLLG